MKSASTLFLHILVEAARDTSVDALAVLAKLGLPSPLDAPPGTRIPLDAARRAWIEIPAQSGDPCFGLHAAERLDAAAFDLVSYLARAACTIGEGIETLATHGRLIADVGHLGLERGEREARFFDATPGCPPHWAELLLGAMARQLRAAGMPDHELVRVELMHDAPATTREHERVFRAPVSFLCPANALVLAPEALARRMTTADERLRAILASHAEELLARTPEATDFVAQVERAIEALILDRREVDVDSVARHLATSARTLQRRLGERSSTFKDLLDRVRHRLAVGLLVERRLVSGEIASILRFSDVSTFQRAFKRWTGTTPRAYASAHRQG
jgi:AraC-like DNA-binding protein